MLNCAAVLFFNAPIAMAEGLPDIYLRFDGIEAECTDELHPGSKADAANADPSLKLDPNKWGWFQFKSFSLNFDVKDSGDSESADKKAGGGAKPAAPKKGAAGAAAGGSKDDTGPHSHPDISVSKSLDSASAVLWQTRCYEGKDIKRVELEACRTGGIPGAPKLPFVRLVFEGVFVKSINMSISEDALPSETLVFSYERVQIESIWTDNETGKRLIEQPRHYGWDFKNNKQWEGPEK